MIIKKYVENNPKKILIDLISELNKEIHHDINEFNEELNNTKMTLKNSIPNDSSSLNNKKELNADIKDVLEGIPRNHELIYNKTNLDKYVNINKGSYDNKDVLSIRKVSKTDRTYRESYYHNANKKIHELSKNATCIFNIKYREKR